jgi:hypothetical protein
MTRDIVISIINFRTADLTIDCARSVLDQIGKVDGEIVIVDNCSGDGSAEKLETWISGLPAGSPVRLVRSRTNTGFSGGHNLGMGEIEARNYLVLNSDAVLRSGFLQRILATARNHPEAGFIAPRLEGPDGTVQTSCFRFPGPLSEFIRGANSGPVTRALKAYDVPLQPDPDPEEIDWASFACILINGTMVREIGPMDVGFFLYFEDVEYCLRARKAGWRIQRCPEAVVVHFRGGSGPVKALAAKGKRLPAYFYSSRTRFMYQAHGRTGLWAANILWVLGRAIAEMRWIASRKGNNFHEAEIRDIWTNVWNPLGPRHAPEE